LAFVFYDCETTGLDTTFDQILQFAAVVTDEDLNVIESLEVRCRLLPHIVPHPAALNVTRTTLASISDPNLPSHYEMMRQVAKAFESWCPATFIGFNSHRFDEKLLHQAFYQTLHDPFVTSRPINGRADALTLCRSVAYFSPGVLEIPYGELAAPSFRLSDLSAANAGPAADHTAAADVQATLHLCQLIRERDPECWSRFLRFSSKRSVDAFLETEPAFGVVGFHGNAPKPTVATLLGAGCVDRNVRYLLDLTADLDKIASYDDGTLAALLPLNDSPVIRVRVNASTALCASYDLPNAMRVLISEDDEEVLVDRIRSDHRLGSRILQALRAAETPFARGTKIEQLVYGGFASEADRVLLAEFHEATWTQRMELITRFEDRRYRQLGERLIYFEVPELLREDRRARLDAAIAERLAMPAGSGPPRSQADALASASQSH
jgi:exodeoxyribonuclease I